MFFFTLSYKMCHRKCSENYRIHFVNRGKPVYLCSLSFVPKK